MFDESSSLSGERVCRLLCILVLERHLCRQTNHLGEAPGLAGSTALLAVVEPAHLHVPSLPLSRSVLCRPLPGVDRDMAGALTNALLSFIYFFN